MLNLKKAVTTAAKELFVKKSQPRSDWFYDSKAIIMPAIKQRNVCTSIFSKNRSPSNKNSLRQAQKNVKLKVKVARNKWILNVARSVNEGASNISINKAGWKAI